MICVVGSSVGIVCLFRFWASVEPYCADITNEEIRLLEELLKPPDDEAEYFKVSRPSGFFVRNAFLRQEPVG